jgi:hypothetical protein
LDKRLSYVINIAANSSNPFVKNTLEALIQGNWEFDMPKKGKNIRKQLKNYIQDEQVITQILQEIVYEAKKDPPRRNDDLMTDSLPQDINLRKVYSLKTKQVWSSSPGETQSTGFQKLSSSM